MLTERSQRRAIFQRFLTAEKEATLDPAKFSEPWRTIYLLAERDEPVYGASAAYHYAVTAVADDDDHAADLRRQIDASSVPPHFPTLAEMAKNLKPVSWLWEGWIPRGMLSLVGAYQGAGKSYFVMDLARSIIAGAEWPDGTSVGRSAPVIYVEAEGIPTVTNERAQRLGIDRERLYMLVADNGQILDLTQRTWQDQLIDMVTMLQPELIIIDSLSTISTNGQNSVEDTTRLLMFLTGLAAYGNCGMLVIHHLRKPSSGQLSLPGVNIHDFRGSSHITAMARTVIGLSVLQTNGSQFSLNGPRRIELAKTNLGPYPEPLGVRLVEDGPDHVHFEYGDAPAAESDKTMVDRCAAWILEMLEGEDMKPSELIEMADEEGFGRRMVYRARKKLGDQVHNTHGKHSPHNKWTLSPEENTDSDDDDEL